MTIERNISIIYKEIKKSSFDQINAKEIIKARNYIVSVFKNTSFELEEVKPHFAKLFKSIIRYNTKLKDISIQIADDKINYEIRDGKRIVNLKKLSNEITSPSFIIEFNDLEIKLKPKIKEEKIIDYNVTLFLKKENEHFYYTLNKNEIKEIAFNERKEIKTISASNIEIGHILLARFDNRYKNLIIKGKNKKIIGYGIMEYSIGSSYYDVKLHPLILYYGGKIKSKIDFNQLNSIKNKKTTKNPIRFKTIIQLLEENLGNIYTKDNYYDLQESKVDKKTLSDILELGEVNFSK